MPLLELNKDNCGEYAVCGYKNPKAAPYRSKHAWLLSRFESGLRHFVLLDDGGKAVGGIEYAPAEAAWRPVVAPKCFVIHCVYIMSKAHKGSGNGRMMLDACIADAKRVGKDGVAVVTRKGSWMAGAELFLSAGFTVVDSAAPDFQLLFLPLMKKAVQPGFTPTVKASSEGRRQGLVLYWSDQCPYLTKSVAEIAEYAEAEAVSLEIVKLESPDDVQASPSAFGNFCLTWNGKLMANNPISRTRFINILKTLK